VLTQQLASGTSHDNVFANDTVVRARLWIRDSRAVQKLKRVDGEFALTPLSVFDTARDSVAANDRI